MLVPCRYTTSNQSHQIRKSVDGQVPVKAVKTRTVKTEQIPPGLRTWMGPLNRVLDRGREPLSREGDLLEIMCPPPLEQWTRPVFAPAGNNTTHYPQQLVKTAD